MQCSLRSWRNLLTSVKSTENRNIDRLKFNTVVLKLFTVAKTKQILFVTVTCKWLPQVMTWLAFDKCVCWCFFGWLFVCLLVQWLFVWLVVCLSVCLLVGCCLVGWLPGSSFGCLFVWLFVCLIVRLFVVNCWSKHTHCTSCIFMGSFISLFIVINNVVQMVISVVLNSSSL